MPDWALAAIVGFLTALGTSITSHWFLRRKTSAEAEHEGAQADKVTGEVYKAAIATLQDSNAALNTEVAALRIRCQREAEISRILHEDKVHAQTYLTMAEAKLAVYENHPLLNGNADLTG